MSAGPTQTDRGSLFSCLDDALSDDLEFQPITLPAPELGNLPEIDHMMRAASITQAGRDALSKFVIRDEYIPKLLPLVTMAEDLESLPDLHRLCNIMKSIILLNDNTIIEMVVTDPIILGVVGALECASPSSTLFSFFFLLLISSLVASNFRVWSRRACSDQLR